jgi:hypothetical protein
MTPSPISASDHNIFERDALRLLCSAVIKPATRVEFCNSLSPVVFLDPLRRVVFEEIHELGPIASKRLRELLPSRVTNRGFPDFEIEELLQPKEVNEDELARLFASVLHLLEIVAEE